MSTEFPSLRIFHTFIQSQKIPPGSSFTDWSSRLLMSANPAEEGESTSWSKSLSAHSWNQLTDTDTIYHHLSNNEVHSGGGTYLLICHLSLLSKLASGTIAGPHLSSCHWLDTRKTFHFQSSCSQTSTCHQSRTLNSLQGAQVEEHTNCESFEA